MGLQDLLLALFIIQINTVHAFWWPSSTTESPMMFKQVPLTYFRTYTYQPLVGNPLAYPFLGNNLFGEQADTSLLNGMRYDRLDSNYANPMLPFITKFNMQTPIKTALSATRITTTRKPSTNRPNTTTAKTTTTTTLEPTTTTTTTPTSTTRSTTTKSSVPKESFYGEHPLYNRRAYYNNMPTYQRQPYPYPNYNMYENGNNGMNYVDRQSESPYMPCMCPVGVSSSDHMRPPSPYATHSRSPYSADITADVSAAVTELELPTETKPNKFFKQSVNDANNRGSASDTPSVTPMSVLRNF